MKGYDPFASGGGFDAPPPRRRGANIEGMRKALMRSNTRLLLSAVMIFQFTAMLLISLQEKPVDTQALILAVALPAVTWLVVMAFGRLWPIDRAMLILALLLCSVGIITLSDIARSRETPLTQAVYALIGIAAMAVGVVFIRSVRHWKKWILPGMVLCLGALASPWAFGSVQNGARNWITIIPDRLTIQPSEFIKPALILILAAALSGRPRFVKCLPAIGFAILLRSMNLKGNFQYLLIGFVLFAYFRIGALGAALVGIALAMIAYYNNQKIADLQNSMGGVDDE